MKQLFSFLILLSFIQCAPKKSVTSDLKKTNIKSIIENAKLNVVYRGIRNPLTIYVPNTDSIHVSGLGIYKIEDNKYYIAPGSGTKVEITITGYIRGEELISKREFRILDIQKPYVSIHNNFGKVTLSKEELANSTIKIHIPQFVMELPEVSSFRYQINKQEPYINRGNSFEELVREQIYNLKKGDSVVIDDIRFLMDKSTMKRKKIIELRIYIK